MPLLRRFPSYDQVLRSAGTTFARFPFTLISALIGTVAAVIAADNPVGPNVQHMMPVVMAAAMGLPLFTTLVALAERRRYGKTGWWTLHVLGVLFVLVYYLSLPSDVVHVEAPVLRFWVLFAGFHFLAAFLPFLRKDEVDTFWQYNKALFLRFLFAGVFSGVLYLGLAIALGAADHLFGLNVIPERYFQLFICIAGIFQTWVFLAGIPGPLDQLEGAGEYPKGLKVLAQFILLPLVGLYFVILIAYEAKIVIEWNLPKGWVSQLVLWYAVVGILSMLLLYPLRKRLENKWIDRFSTWYFRLMIPLVVMLFLAIITRVKDYGVTEPRYFVMALAVGLSAVMIYFIVSRVRDIRTVPIVLCLLAFVSATGPWGAFSVSKRSQLGRLTTMLTEAGLGTGVARAEDTAEPSFQTRSEMSGLIRYLLRTHGLSAFSGLLPDTTIERMVADSTGRTEQIAAALGFDAAVRGRFGSSGEHFSTGGESSLAVPLVHYDYLIDYHYSWRDYIVPPDTVPSSEQPKEYVLGDDTVRVSIDSLTAELTVHVTTADHKSASLKFPLAHEIHRTEIKSSGRSALRVNQRWLERSVGPFEVRLFLRNLEGSMIVSRVHVTQADALILIRTRQR